MTRQKLPWIFGGHLIAGLAVLAAVIIDDRLSSVSQVGKIDIAQPMREEPVVEQILEPSVISESSPAAVPFDPDVEALSDVDIEMRMAGLPAQKDYLDYSEHLAARGWGIPNQTEYEYQNFDWETLESMADAGDFIALTALERKISSNMSGDLSLDRERLAQVREKAAMFGMTTSSILQGQSLLDEYLLLLESPEMDTSPAYKNEAPRKRVIDGMAWLDFSAYRGDLHAVQEMANAIANPALAITQDELKAAKAEAMRIYDRLAMQRAARGLPEFDNDLSPGAFRVYEVTLNTPVSAAIRNGE